MKAYDVRWTGGTATTMAGFESCRSDDGERTMFMTMANDKGGSRRLTTDAWDVQETSGEGCDAARPRGYG